MKLIYILNIKSIKTILLTGSAGFIGSNLVTHILQKHPNYKVINIDLLTYAGNLENLKSIEKEPNYTFIEGDIRDRALIEKIFKEYNIQGVMHLAAESHVDNSISNPNVFIETNINGTFTLIDVAYKYWMEKPFVYKAGFENSRFLHVSTDEVYGSLGETGLFTEKTPYAPNSPYSASKASSDMIVRSYHHTYGMNTIITYNGKNYEIVKENRSWVASAAVAVERGGFLAEINDLDEQNAIFDELGNASIIASNTVAPDGGNASYVWIGGNDITTEGNWFWDGNNDGTGNQFWMGTLSGSPVNSLYNNWGDEPDDFGSGQDGLGLALTDWPFGVAGQWNDVAQTNELYFIIEFD